MTDRDATDTPSNRQIRVVVIASIVALHTTLYYAVNLVNSRRSPADLVDLTIPLDRLVPYLGWTWVVYYGGDLFITVGAAFVLWRLTDRQVLRAAEAYAGIIVIGAVIQLLVPSSAPWPGEMIEPQRWMHEAIGMRPHACLPSMHVALSVLPAGLALSTVRSAWGRACVIAAAALITGSTVTLKEHFVLDSLAGLALGIGGWAYWRARVRSPVSPHDDRGATPAARRADSGG